MKISREDVLRVAELAQLELAPAEVELYRGQLDEILTYIDKLNELDTSRVEPMAQVLISPQGGTTPSSTVPSIEPNLNPAVREDIERPQHAAGKVLKIAPDPAPPYFRVPRVIER
jgi:aspartyl-tRNA(Asn)/glutamyl-tRNA(Gln) amidotransferase subunit C